ncbi:hypothetical protein N7540_000805 [Penicillium herquei]|nr:hypothetical protein N7540_000805 [Penicillium herquei]
MAAHYVPRTHTATRFRRKERREKFGDVIEDMLAMMCIMLLFIATAAVFGVECELDPSLGMIFQGLEGFAFSVPFVAAYTGVSFWDRCHAAH